MIEKNEILEVATSLNLQPDTVEKDYVLGWLLYGIQSSRKTNSWLFKGGTSLKKCFFETFRFSEDLDFTLKEASHLKEDFLIQAFKDICEIVNQETGIEFFVDQIKFKIIPKDNNHFSAQGKIPYNGPLRRKQGHASIKLDLTSDELIVLSGENKRVHHPYSDEPSGGIHALCYSFEEVVAEKIRALGQRARPRDVYDVVHFFRNRNLIGNPQLVYNTLIRKCEYKKIEVPTFESVNQHEKIDELAPQWSHMLEHQLPNLPPLESFWEDLPPFFDWLVGSLNEERLVSQVKQGEEPITFERISYGRIDPILHKIQFSAASRVCVKMTYNGKTRTIEPVSFRRASSGNRLFYGFERETQQIKCFTLAEIRSLEITNLPFQEKFPVEISASGSISMPPVRRTVTPRQSSPRVTRSAYKGLKYKFRCPGCEKIFYRTSYDSKLNEHKNKDGYRCFGRHGIFEGH